MFFTTLIVLKEHIQTHEIFKYEEQNSLPLGWSQMNTLKPPVFLPSAHCAELEATMVVGRENISGLETNPVMDTGSDYIAPSL